MRFIAGTPDIPDELINDVSDGRAVFLCGAGVSKRIGMPLFGKLTDQIYAELGETPNNEAAEIEALKRHEYDRALRSLERRTRLPRMASRVRTATTKLLTPANGLAVPDHLNLLRLSRDAEGRVFRLGKVRRTRTSSLRGRSVIAFREGSDLDRGKNCSAV
jgi:hypothetical protein